MPMRVRLPPSALMNKPMPTLPEKYISRFWSRVSKGASDECWDWLAGCFKSGYGSFKIFYTTLLTHRVAYYLHYGKDPGDLCACHTCDNPKCCNPHHLWLGTHGDNSRDKIRKGRWAGREQHGSKNSNAKLTDRKVKEIRRLHATEKYTLGQLAMKYGVSHVAIHYVVTQKTWTHVKCG